MAKVGKEVLKRLTAPELREIVKEELTAALQPLTLKIDEMDKRIQNQISELDKRLSSKIDEMDKRITSEIGMLRSELQYAPRVAVLEVKLNELEKKLSKTQ
ncbi:MAG: hypothetical protein ACK4TI_00055 [Nitrososphaerales archaeon]